MSLVPLQPHTDPKNVSAVQMSPALQLKNPVNFAEPRRRRETHLMGPGPWEALKEELVRVPVAVMYTSVMCTAGDQTDVVILDLRTQV